MAVKSSSFEKPLCVDVPQRGRCSQNSTVRLVLMRMLLWGGINVEKKLNKLTRPVHNRKQIVLFTSLLIRACKSERKSRQAAAPLETRHFSEGPALEWRTFEENNREMKTQRMPEEGLEMSKKKKTGARKKNKADFFFFSPFSVAMWGVRVNLRLSTFISESHTFAHTHTHTQDLRVLKVKRADDSELACAASFHSHPHSVWLLMQSDVSIYFQMHSQPCVKHKAKLLPQPCRCAFTIPQDEMSNFTNAYMHFFRKVHSF